MHIVAFLIWVGVIVWVVHGLLIPVLLTSSSHAAMHHPPVICKQGQAFAQSSLRMKVASQEE